MSTPRTIVTPKELPLDRGDMFTHLLRFGGEPAWRAMAAKDLAASADKAAIFGTFHSTFARINACVTQIERECALLKGPVAAESKTESKTESKKATPFTVYDVLSDAPLGAAPDDDDEGGSGEVEYERWMTHSGTPLDAAASLAAAVKDAGPDGAAYAVFVNHNEERVAIVNALHTLLTEYTRVKRQPHGDLFICSERVFLTIHAASDFGPNIKVVPSAVDRVISGSDTETPVRHRMIFNQVWNVGPVNLSPIYKPVLEKLAADKSVPCREILSPST